MQSRDIPKYTKNNNPDTIEVDNQKEIYLWGQE